MAVKAAPLPGTVVVEEKRTRLEAAPPEENNGRTERQKHPPMWEWIETLTPEQWSTREYEMTIYRGRKHDRGAWCGKFYEPMTPERIQQKFGGGWFVVYMKVPPGNQLRYFEDIEIYGPVKTAEEIAPAANDATSQMIAMLREEMRAMREEIRAARGGDTASKAMEQAVALNGQVFSAAVPAVTNALAAANGGNHNSAPSERDRMMDRFLDAIIAKAMNPADPIMQFKAMVDAMNGIGLGKPAASSSTVEIFRGVMQALPSVAQHFGGIMDSYRRAEEAKANHAAIIRGGVPALPPAPAAAAAPAVLGARLPDGQAQAPPSNVLEMPPPAAPPPAQPPGYQDPEQAFQLIEWKVKELIESPSLTPEEAAGKAFEFIDVMDANLVAAMVAQGAGGLQWAFANRPILSQIQKGERVEKFIAEFIRIGAESKGVAPPA